MRFIQNINRNKFPILTVLISASLGSYSRKVLSPRTFNSFRKMSTIVDYSALIPPQPAPTWDHTADSIVEEAKTFNAQLIALNDKIASVEDPTLDGIFEELAQFENRQAEKTIGSYYMHVHPDKKLRDASNTADELIEQVLIEQRLREDMFKTMDKLYQKYYHDESVDPEVRRFLLKKHIFYKQNGLHLPAEERKKVQEIQKKMSTLSQEFNKNMNEEDEFILFTKEDLDGVPDDVIDGFAKVTEDGVDKLKMTFKYPDVLPVRKYANLESTRKAAWAGSENKLAANRQILKDIVVLRIEQALVLGYETFAHYAIEEKMAKTPETVYDFLNDLNTKLKPRAKQELEHLLALKNEDLKSRGLPPHSELYIWDYSFYNNLLLEREYKVDDIKISEYFPLDSTISKMLGFYEKLFNMKFVEILENRSVWHEDAKQYAVWSQDDPKNPEFLGWLYFDLHPREGKYSHAANIPILSSYVKENGENVYTVTSLVCNFTKPTKDKPSLLKHSEVTTFFHELGHGVHSIFGRARYARFSGTAVSRDFVEAPSQMLEYWTWQADQVRELSSHYKTGEKMDDELLNSLIKSKHVNQGIFSVRQLFFGFFDMAVHSVKTVEEAKALDFSDLWNSMSEDIFLVKNGGEVSHGYSSFGHIVGGYAAGYYGYMFSLVYAADIYHTLFAKDPMNVESGIRYRDILLTKGGVRDEIDTLKELLGREPNSIAFVTELGI